MQKDIKPLIPVNPEGLDEIARQLLNESTTDRSSAKVVANVDNPESYIILPGKKHNNYSYQDILVSKERFYFKKNWHQAHTALHSEDSFMLNVRQFVDFINLLKTGKAFDGRGKKIDGKELEKILDEIIAVRKPWRAEWLDSDFKVVNEELFINYDHRTVNGKLKPKYSELLEKCLMENKTPGINLDYWLKNANKHGLPAEKTPEGKMYYWCPMKDNNSVAWFGADSDWAYLYCGWYPSISDGGLGVRRAKNRE